MEVDRVVSLVDLAPTFCEMAGLTPPVTMQGRSLRKLLDDPAAPGHADECFFEYDEQKGKKYPVRGVVTREYKFIDYLDDTDVLYDLRRDPGETRNVASELQYAAVAKVLQNRVEQWRKQTKDLPAGGAVEVAIGGFQFSSPVSPVSGKLRSFPETKTAN